MLLTFKVPSGRVLLFSQLNLNVDVVSQKPHLTTFQARRETSTEPERKKPTPSLFSKA